MAVEEEEDVGALGDSGSSLPGLIDAYPLQVIRA